MRDDRNREPEVCLVSLTDINMKEARPAGPQVPSSVWSEVNTSTLSLQSEFINQTEADVSRSRFRKSSVYLCGNYSGSICDDIIVILRLELLENFKQRTPIIRRKIRAKSLSSIPSRSRYSIDYSQSTNRHRSLVRDNSNSIIR